jgi:hypothetical protein
MVILCYKKRKFPSHKLHIYQFISPCGEAKSYKCKDDNEAEGLQYNDG